MDYISSAEAFEFLEARAEANHSEHYDHIRAWLNEIGFSGRRYPRAHFERLSSWFPSSVPPVAVINVFHRVPWSPPEQLTLDVLREYRNEPRIWISTVANLMAFGRSTPPEDLEPMGIIARRRQAITALFDAPARKGLIRLVGSPDIEGGDRSDDIPPSYFDVPRNLGDPDNSIYTDLPRISEACEGPDANWDAARHDRHQRWFNVRADGPSCISWMEGCIVSFEPKPKVEQSLSARAKSLPIVPEGDGSMPVSAALHWIASEGLKINDAAPITAAARRARKGPAPGSVDRFRDADRALYPEMERIILEQRISATAAARKLAEEGKVAGYGTWESKARRLRRLFLSDYWAPTP
jgi:hypothetical protein